MELARWPVRAVVLVLSALLAVARAIRTVLWWLFLAALLLVGLAILAALLAGGGPP